MSCSTTSMAVRSSKLRLDLLLDVTVDGQLPGADVDDRDGEVGVDAVEVRAFGVTNGLMPSYFSSSPAGSAASGLRGPWEHQVGDRVARPDDQLRRCRRATTAATGHGAGTDQEASPAGRPAAGGDRAGGRSQVPRRRKERTCEARRGRSPGRAARRARRRPAGSRRRRRRRRRARRAGWRRRRTGGVARMPATPASTSVADEHAADEHRLVGRAERRDGPDLDRGRGQVDHRRAHGEHGARRGRSTRRRGGRPPCRPARRGCRRRNAGAGVPG